MHNATFGILKLELMNAPSRCPHALIYFKIKFIAGGVSESNLLVLNMTMSDYQKLRLNNVNGGYN